MRGSRFLCWLAVMALLMAPLALNTKADADTINSGPLTLVNTDPLTAIGEMSGGQMPMGTSDFTPLDAMIDLIDNTPAGADLHAAFWELQRVAGHDMVEALGNAKLRGVNVVIVIDRQLTNGANRNDQTIAELSGSPYHIPITACLTGCNSGNGIAHSKFFLFSETVDPTGTTRFDVVANGSQNINDQQNRVHNNFVVSYDDPVMYAGFLGYWNALNNEVADASNPAVSQPVGSTTGKVTTYFFPRDAQDDPIADFVGKLDCSRGGEIFGQSATWASDRVELNNLLMAQSDAGCTVRLLMGHSNAPVANDGSEENEYQLPPGTNQPMNANIFARHGIKVFGLAPGGCRYVDHPSKKTNCHGAPGGTHQKYLVIRGWSAQGNPINEVITGAENFTKRALTVYTDTAQVISDPVIVQGFEDDFERQKAKAVSLHPEKYPNATFTTTNSAAAGSQDKPEVAKAGGYTAIAWADDGNPMPASSGKYGAIYVKLTYNGTPIYELPIQSQAVATSGSDYRAPQVGVDSAGNVAVAWQDDHDGNGSYDIVLRRVTNNGSGSPVVGGRTTVNANSAHNQTSPSLAMTSAGEVSVAWTDNASGNTQIRLATFSAAGTKVNEMRVNSTTSGGHNQPAVAAYPISGGDTATVVVWRDDSNADGSGLIRGRAVTADGTPIWSERQLSTASTGNQTVPAIAAHAGEVVVAWVHWTGSAGTPCRTYGVLPSAKNDPNFPPNGHGRCVQIREFDATGAASGPEFEASKGLFDTGGYASYTEIGAQRSPDIAMAANGNYVVTWQELTPHRMHWDIYARSFTPGGGSTAATLSEYIMNPISAGKQVNPSVATDDAGNFVLVYNDDNDGNGSTQIHQRTGFTIG